MTAIAPQPNGSCSTQSPSPKTRPHYKTAYLQCLAMQEALAECLKDPDASYADKAKSALAWEKLEDRKRILRNRGLPKSVPARNDPGARKAGKAKYVSGPLNVKPNEPARPIGQHSDDTLV